MIMDILITLMLVVGGIFGLVGSFGLIRLPDAMTRLHAPTKATTLGVGGVLIASMLYFASQGAVSAHELMISLFLFLTAPITAHFVAKVHLHKIIRRSELPPTGTDAGWAGFTAEGPVKGGRPKSGPATADGQTATDPDTR